MTSSLRYLVKAKKPTETSQEERSQQFDRLKAPGALLHLCHPAEANDCNLPSSHLGVIPSCILHLSSACLRYKTGEDWPEWGDSIQDLSAATAVLAEKQKLPQCEKVAQDPGPEDREAEPCEEEEQEELAEATQGQAPPSPRRVSNPGRRASEREMADQSSDPLHRLDATMGFQPGPPLESQTSTQRRADLLPEERGRDHRMDLFIRGADRRRSPPRHPEDRREPTPDLRRPQSTSRTRPKA